MQNNEKSKYVRNGRAQAELVLKNTTNGSTPEKPKHPSGALPRIARIIKTGPFDVRYVFDDKKQKDNAASFGKTGRGYPAFGCSYTFGYGLKTNRPGPQIIQGSWPRLENNELWLQRLRGAGNAGHA